MVKRRLFCAAREVQSDGNDIDGKLQVLMYMVADLTGMVYCNGGFNVPWYSAAGFLGEPVQPPGHCKVDMDQTGTWALQGRCGSDR